VFTLLLTSKVLDKIAILTNIEEPLVDSIDSNQDLRLMIKPPHENIQNAIQDENIQNAIHVKSIKEPHKPVVTKPGTENSHMDEAINRERSIIDQELVGYSFPPSVGPESLILERGGQPVRAMVATTWRSGSTFLGDIMSAHPATFYHYEPLLHYDIKQARSGALAEDAVRTIKSLMQCNYSKVDRYLKYGMSHPWLFQHNKRLWKYCPKRKKKQRKTKNSMCWKPEFLNRFCPLFPFQSIKTVRLRLNLTKSLVEDASLNVRVLLLVRDPRGTMQSRNHRVWCPDNPDCEDPARLCSDLVSDFHSFKALQSMYPDKYKIFRYEDFSMNPSNNTADVFNFFGLSFHPKVRSFLRSHTKSNRGGVSSTFRDSKTAPFKWREQLSIEEVEDIQDKCSEAMELWGYRKVPSPEQLKTFDPVIDLENFRISQRTEDKLKSL